MLTRQALPARETHRTGAQVGYLVAIAVNGALLFVAQNVLAWDVLPFLTEDFEQVLPVISLSLLASMMVNAMYLWYDPQWFKSVGQIALAGVSMAATVRLYRVFPFDFSSYGFDWTTLTRVLLFLAMAGIVVGVVAEVVKLAAALRSWRSRVSHVTSRRVSAPARGSPLACPTFRGASVTECSSERRAGGLLVGQGSTLR